MKVIALAFSTILPFMAAAAPLQQRAVSLTQLEIPSMNVHFMGSNSGLPGGQWPEGDEFNSTITFTLNYPTLSDNTTLSSTCSGNWTQGQPSLDWTACDNSAVAWKFDNFTSEANFVLRVSRQVSVASAFAGSVHITANNLSSNTSYLTCLSGAPLTGIKCNLDGVLSSKKSPIPIPVSGAAAPTF